MDVGNNSRTEPLFPPGWNATASCPQITDADHEMTSAVSFWVEGVALCAVALLGLCGNFISIHILSRYLILVRSQSAKWPYLHSSGFSWGLCPEIFLLQVICNANNCRGEILKYWATPSAGRQPSSFLISSSMVKLLPIFKQ